MTIHDTIKTLAYICLGLVFVSFETHASEPAPVGNFALPGSQQQGPLLGIGQNIIDQGQTQVTVGGNLLSGKHRYESDIAPSLLYGITNNFSAVIELPFAIKNRDGENKSSGVKDLLVQFEYAPYSHDTSLYSEQATIMGGITAPTGSTKKNPNTGVGSASFIAGATYSRTYTDWYGFVSPGTIQTMSHHETKYGNQYIYQAGLGKNICAVPNEWIFSWLVEVDGSFTTKDKIDGLSNPDSGGNVVYVTPSLWFSNKHLSIQVGVGFPVIQKLNGTQNKNRYLLAANIGWTF